MKSALTYFAAGVAYMVALSIALTAWARRSVADSIAGFDVTPDPSRQWGQQSRRLLPPFLSDHCASCVAAQLS